MKTTHAELWSILRENIECNVQQKWRENKLYVFSFRFFRAAPSTGNLLRTIKSLIIYNECLSMARHLVFFKWECA